MTYFSRPLFAAALAATALSSSAFAGVMNPIPGDPIAIDTGKVSGTLLDGGLKGYFGIPFAAPPVRENRWRPCSIPRRASLTLHTWWIATSSSRPQWELRQPREQRRDPVAACRGRLGEGRLERGEAFRVRFRQGFFADDLREPRLHLGGKRTLLFALVNGAVVFETKGSLNRQTVSISPA